MISQTLAGASRAMRPFTCFLKPVATALCAFVWAQTTWANFSDVSDTVGIDDFEVIVRNPQDFVVRGGTPIVMDFDDNGWLDLYIIRYQLDDLLYLNNEGVFTKSVNPLGLDTKNGGNAGAWADIDNDGDKDMIVAVADAKSHRRNRGRRKSRWLPRRHHRQLGHRLRRRLPHRLPRFVPKSG